MNWGQATPYYAGPRRVVIVDKLRHEVIQVPLAEDNELAQALQLDRLNELTLPPPVVPVEMRGSPGSD